MPDYKLPYEFYIFSDGSGYLDHVGGFAAIVCAPTHPECKHVTSCGCSTHMETGRAEFTAVLTALHSILESMGWTKHTYMEYLERNRPKVLVTSDRMDLVGSINREFRRESNPDLWAQFEWYEKYFNIKATHVRRETHQTQTEADVLASEMRIVCLSFLNTQKEINAIKD